MPLDFTSTVLPDGQGSPAAVRRRTNILKRKIYRYRVSIIGLFGPHISPALTIKFKGCCMYWLCGIFGRKYEYRRHLMADEMIDEHFLVFYLSYRFFISIYQLNIWLGMGVRDKKFRKQFNWHLIVFPSHQFRLQLESFSPLFQVVLALVSI